MGGSVKNGASYDHQIFTVGCLEDSSNFGILISIDANKKSWDNEIFSKWEITQKYWYQFWKQPRLTES